MLANCKRCERLFQKVVRDICPDCIKEQQELVRLIKEYLREHPNATIPEVATFHGDNHRRHYGFN